MGAWGNGPWDGDTAWDWVFTITQQLSGEVTQLLDNNNDQAAFARIDALVAIAERADVQLHIPHALAETWMYSLLTQSLHWRNPEERVEKIYKVFTALSHWLVEKDEEDGETITLDQIHRLVAE